jgi:iron-sulfur cluster assembly accessory protein
MDIRITPAARAHFERLLGAEKPSLRLALRRAGCAGGMFDLTASPAQEGDVLTDCAGVTLAVPAGDAATLEGTVVDAVSDGLGNRVVFENARIQARCGCGLSVNLPC